MENQWKEQMPVMQMGNGKKLMRLIRRRCVIKRRMRKRYEELCCLILRKSENQITCIVLSGHIKNCLENTLIYFRRKNFQADIWSVRNTI